jgi:DNA topoisomerase-1
MARYTLIITEKPDAALKIAQALDMKQEPRRRMLHHVPYYTANRDRQIVIVPAIGHLYTVVAEKKEKNHYPVLAFQWQPRYVAERKARQTRWWIENISELARDADTFIDACDYDIEGSVIGYTLLKYACGNKEALAKRMKYSTLTEEDLEKAYAELLPHLDFALVEAGLARHEVDWLYGINLTRALTIAAKNHTGRYTTLSTGRVQGPTLKFLVLRERNIRTFVPVPYWIVKAEIEIDGRVYQAEYEKAKVETKSKADTTLDATRDKDGQIERIETKKYQQSPPVPFDLGALQGEAYRIFGYTPKRTLNIAQKLYLDASISYPRTSSQKLPATIGYEAILKNLSRLPEYRELVAELLAKPPLKPYEGRKEDPAHPAIYPTGKHPERQLDPMEKRILDLVTRRFTAAFAEWATMQSIKATINVNEHHFYLRGRQILNEGWLRFYEPYTRSKQIILPDLEEGQTVKIKEIINQDRFTRPPPRHNPASLLKKMEEAGIGTKATRADMIQTLYGREYVRDEEMVVTDLGFRVLEVLEKFCPTVVSIELTRELEEKMGRIQANNEKREAILMESVETVRQMAEKLKENEKAIGAQLSEAIKKSKTEERTIGSCPTCQTGKLTILYSRKTGKRFVGCTNYFKGQCQTSFPLPQKGTIKPLGRTCRRCGWPTVQVRMRGRRPWILCFNPKCPSKEERRKRFEMQNM